MRLRVEVALLFIINMVWIWHTLCDGNSTNSEANKSECNCHSKEYSILSADCLSSCNCGVGMSKYSTKDMHIVLIVMGIVMFLFFTLGLAFYWWMHKQVVATNLKSREASC